jgi:DNA modification methylase
MNDWTSEDGAVRLICGDCLEILPTLEAGGVDAVVTDPPYGIKYDAGHSKYKNGVNRNGGAEWDKAPFDPRPIINLGLPTILWGGNCFASRLPDHAGWLCWRKTVRNGAKIRQADMELAWTNCVKRSQTFEHLWIGAYKASESGIRNVHPTQKPIIVMEWCLSLLPNATTILDPFMGSGTTGVACVNTGRRFVGIELDPGYFEIAKRRIQAAMDKRAEQLIPAA